MAPPPPPGGPRRWPIVVAVLAGVAVIGLVLVGVLAARSSGDESNDPPARPDRNRPTTSSPAESTDPAEPDPDPDPTGGLRPGAVDGPGVEVVNEARGWAMVVDPAWTEADLDFTEAAWYLGSANDPSADNVNLLIEELGARMPATLEAYVDASLQGLETVFVEAEVLRREFVTADDGTRLAILEYAVQYEGLDLHIVQVILATSDRGAAATFTTMSGDPTGAVERVLPYLLSLRLR